MDVPRVTQGVESRLAAAVEMARAAGANTLRYFRDESYVVDQKRDGSVVTTADREAEQLISQEVASRFSGDGFLGEEFGERTGSSGFRWVVDPIDGTASFVHGVPLFGTLIGIEQDGKAVGGVIFMSALDEMVFGGIGLGAWHVRGELKRPARVSGVGRLRDGMVCITSFDYFTKSEREAEFHSLCRACRSLRGWSDCYAHVLVATGRIEAVVEPAVHPWDVAATIPIMREAGGLFTDWSGEETAYSGNGVASNGLVHEQVLRSLRVG